jgi:hypothetical protein
MQEVQKLEKQNGHRQGTPVAATRKVIRLLGNEDAVYLVGDEICQSG